MSPTWDGTATPLSDARIGCPHSPPDRRSWAPVSRCDDTPLLTNSSDSCTAPCHRTHQTLMLRRGSAHRLHHINCKIASSPQHTCPRCEHVACQIPATKSSSENNTKVLSCRCLVSESLLKHTPLFFKTGECA